MKIKPDDIPIPCDDPFHHDLLDRKTTILTLTNLLQNLESPYTMSIDASWGNGKTTFLKMWMQHLKNQGLPVVSFNAWETDFTRNPFVVLSSELLDALREYEKQKRISLSTLKATMRDLYQIFAAEDIGGFVALTGSYLSIQQDEPFIGLAGSALTWIASALKRKKPRPINYLAAKAAVESFKKELGSIAKRLPRNHDHHPLVIAIDELDRCRPSYAVELLEIAKHLFSVDHVVFVLAIDKTQLTHAIRALYGSEFDSVGYLRRFIDLDFQLPNPNRTKFMTQLMNQTKLRQFFENYSGHSWGESADTQRLLETYLSLPALSLRQIQQAMHRLGLVLGSLDSPTNISYGAIAVLVILKTIDPITYQRFVNSDMTDREVSDKLFGMPELQDIRSTNEGALFETLLIMGYYELALAKNRDPRLGTPSLFHHYFHIIDNDPDFMLSDATDTVDPPLSSHEHRVLNHLKRHFLMFQEVRRGRAVGFNLTVQRLELFSDDLPVGDS